MSDFARLIYSLNMTALLLEYEMQMPELDNLYSATNLKTRAIWRESIDPGNPIQAYYAPQKFALATGFQPQMSGPIKALFSELHSLTRNDSLADLQPVSGFHFTFVPLTLPLYEENEQLPAKIDQLVGAWSPFEGQTITIRDLRLVALPGQLLLAGIPEIPATALRQTFCEQILNSPWKDELLLRHAKTPLPAPFWHTTLLRYGVERLPESLRSFFLERESQRYGEVAGKLKLVRINYNWTRCYPVTLAVGGVD
jgi:hypothetical protein